MEPGGDLIGADLIGATAAFVLTLEMDGESFAALEALRRRYYAPERNLVPAHLTLFGRLPVERGREIKALLGHVAAGERPLELECEGARAIEKGVAIFLQSPRLHALRESLATEWSPWLDPGDGIGFRPHVTIQTTESDREISQTLQKLRGERLPRSVRGTGLHLWRYRDGPWTSERLFRFG